MACGAELVCRVAKTMWPVSAASVAIFAVSRSRISPIRIASGSWRMRARRRFANFRSIVWFTWLCVTPSSWISIGSSIVEMLSSGLLISWSAE
jgi:hypothetical protein